MPQQQMDTETVTASHERDSAKPYETDHDVGAAGEGADAGYEDSSLEASDDVTEVEGERDEELGQQLGQEGGANAPNEQGHEGMGADRRAPDVADDDTGEDAI